MNVLEGNTFNFGMTEPLPVKPVMDAEPPSLVSRVIEIVKLFDYKVKNTCLFIYFAIERFLMHYINLH